MRLHQNLLILSILILLALVLTLPFVLDRDHRSHVDEHAATNGILNNAKQQLASMIERDDERRHDGDLVLSGWISDSRTLHQLDTTEDRAVNISFPAAGKSIISCAFTNPNHVVGGSNDTAEVTISDLHGELSVTSNKCGYQENDVRQWRSIICASYNPTSNPRNTVGVCASTSGTGNLASVNSRALIRQTTKSFYRELKPFLDQGLIQQSDPNQVPTTPASIIPDTAAKLFDVWTVSVN